MITRRRSTSRRPICLLLKRTSAASIRRLPSRSRDRAGARRRRRGRGQPRLLAAGICPLLGAGKNRRRDGAARSAGGPAGKTATLKHNQAALAAAGFGTKGVRGPVAHAGDRRNRQHCEVEAYVMAYSESFFVIGISLILVRWLRYSCQSGGLAKLQQRNGGSAHESDTEVPAVTLSASPRAPSVAWKFREN